MRAGFSEVIMQIRHLNVLRDGAIRGLGANGLALLVTLIIQVLSVPVFLYSVGVNAYAEWLILTAIPSYLSLTDLGFGGYRHEGDQLSRERRN